MAGARGLMQVKNLSDPATNVRIGAAIL
ncbi:Transglycosylase SLT domain-containing protein [Burkholderia cepacia]